MKTHEQAREKAEEVAKLCGYDCDEMLRDSIAEALLDAQKEAVRERDDARREYFAAKALQGFCANPSIFAPNGVNGWNLVNCSNEDLVGYAFSLADTALTTYEQRNDEGGGK